MRTAAFVVIAAPVRGLPMVMVFELILAIVPPAGMPGPLTNMPADKPVAFRRVIEEALLAAVAIWDTGEVEEALKISAPFSVPPPRIAAEESARVVFPVIAPVVTEGKRYVPELASTVSVPLPLAFCDIVRVLPETLNTTVLAGMFAPPMVIPGVMLNVPVKETTDEPLVVVPPVRVKASLKLV